MYTIVQLDGMGLNRGIIIHLLKDLAFPIECRCIFLKTEHWLSSHESHAERLFHGMMLNFNLVLSTFLPKVFDQLQYAKIQVIKGWRWEWSGNQDNSISRSLCTACNTVCTEMHASSKASSIWRQWNKFGQQLCTVR